jgi:hypothetical protein
MHRVSTFGSLLCLFLGKHLFPRRTCYDFRFGRGCPRVSIRNCSSSWFSEQCKSAFSWHVIECITCFFLCFQFMHSEGMLSFVDLSFLFLHEFSIHYVYWSIFIDLWFCDFLPSSWLVSQVFIILYCRLCTWVQAWFIQLLI